MSSSQIVGEKMLQGRICCVSLQMEDALLVLRAVIRFR